MGDADMVDGGLIAHIASGGFEYIWVYGQAVGCWVGEWACRHSALGVGL